MKKTYILYCCIISVILMPFKWFAPENNDGFIGMGI